VENRRVREEQDKEERQNRALKEALLA